MFSQRTRGFLSCRYFGCSKGMPSDGNSTLSPEKYIRVDVATARVLQQDEARLRDAYELYYKRLFAFLRGREYAYVDVRRGIYVGLQALHPNVSIQVPFVSANQAQAKGDMDWGAMVPKEARCNWRHGCRPRPEWVNHSLDWPHSDLGSEGTARQEALHERMARVESSLQTISHDLASLSGALLHGGGAGRAAPVPS